jgi:hypothetical protein
MDVHAADGGVGCGKQKAGGVPAGLPHRRSDSGENARYVLDRTAGCIVLAEQSLVLTVHT